jgi:hypothetical protein
VQKSFKMQWAAVSIHLLLTSSPVHEIPLPPILLMKTVHGSSLGVAGEPPIILSFDGTVSAPFAADRVHRPQTNAKQAANMIVRKSTATILKVNQRFCFKINLSFPGQPGIKITNFISYFPERLALRKWSEFNTELWTMSACEGPYLFSMLLGHLDVVFRSR